MKKQVFTKIRTAMKGKGFIVALALSVAAVGFSTYYAYNSVMNGFGGEDSDELFMEVDKNQPGIPLVTTSAPNSPSVASATTAVTAMSPSELTTAAEENAPENAAANNSASPENAPSDTSAEPQTEPANNFFAASSPRTLPIDGEIINDYSDGELVKSQTLNLWQTHDGVDIAAEVGTEVKACAEGTVVDIWDDALWGICLSIDHGDGHVSTLCGLDASVPVSIGQEVACGDIVGKAGNTAECECSLAPHIHFEVVKDGSYTDPLAFVES